ncbi:MAG: hypothetical protein JO001_08290 [Alphaproteobacteria bacterium]|nr:hypothetical protein [Alphaproteobacteria bacterium]
MLRLLGIAMALTVAAKSWAQSSTPAPQNQSARAVLGPSGTMYDGNNADLRLLPEPDPWFAEKWAGYVPIQTSGAPATATGAGAAGAGLGTTETGGEH